MRQLRKAGRSAHVRAATLQPRYEHPRTGRQLQQGDVVRDLQFPPSVPSSLNEDNDDVGAKAEPRWRSLARRSIADVDCGPAAAISFRPNDR